MYTAKTTEAVVTFRRGRWAVSYTHLDVYKRQGIKSKINTENAYTIRF